MPRDLVEIAWEITDECNYNCIHCYNPKKRNDLQFHEVIKILEEIKDMGATKIKYGGGEPLIREDFLDILRKTINLGFDTTFSTNGFIVNEELVLKIKDTNVSRVQVSLDGNKYVHNYIRKNNQAYDKAINAIKLFVKDNFRVSVATTLINKNLDCLDDLSDICLNLGVDRWRVMKYIPILRKDLVPSVYEYKKAHDQLVELRKKSKELDIFVAKEFDEVCFIKDKYDFQCFGGRSILSIKSNGDVTPCSYFPNLIIGNLRESGLKELWDSEAMLKFANEFYGNKDCEHYELCKGGCKAASFYLNGEKNWDPYCWV